MKNLKSYPNLQKIYRKNQNKLLIWLIIFAVLTIAFLLASLLIENFFDEGGVVFVIVSPIWLLVFVIACLASRSAASKSLSRFTPRELERIDAVITQLQMQEGYGVTPEALVFVKNKLFLYPVRDILWIYKHVVTTRLYGVIPVSSQSSIMVSGRDGKQYSCKTKKKTEEIAFLQSQLSQYRKGIFYGYSQELSTMYKKDINRVIAMSEERDSRP